MSIRVYLWIRFLFLQPHLNLVANNADGVDFQLNFGDCHTFTRFQQVLKAVIRARDDPVTDLAHFEWHAKMGANVVYATDQITLAMKQDRTFFNFPLYYAIFWYIEK